MPSSHVAARAVMTLTEFAKAKINLTLEVLGKRPDGYHELCSLAAFAPDFGDRLTLTPHQPFSLRLSGPMAGAIEGANLIEMAVSLLRERLHLAATGAFHLEKHIPVAAGLGGGSADAAAAMRALLEAYPRHGLNADEITGIARQIGADVPACLTQMRLIMAGVGEKITVLDDTQPFPGILVNPGIKLATKDVFARLNAPPLPTGFDQPAKVKLALAALRGTGGARAFIQAGRNDLEPPARAIAPVIDDVLGALRGLEGCWLARLSGSGPTCFGLFETQPAADDAGLRLKKSRPEWWVIPVRLG